MAWGAGYVNNQVRHAKAHDFTHTKAKKKGTDLKIEATNMSLALYLWGYVLDPLVTKNIAVLDP